MLKHHPLVYLHRYRCETSFQNLIGPSFFPSYYHNNIASHIKEMQLLVCGEVDSELIGPSWLRGVWELGGVLPPSSLTIYLVSILLNCGPFDCTCVHVCIYN